MEIDPKFFAGYTNLGFAYQSMEKYEKSIECFNKALGIQTEDPVTLNNRSYSKMKLGDLKGAMEDVNLSIALMPGNSYAYRNRAMIYISMGKKDKACVDIKTAIEKGFTEAYGNSIMDLMNENCN